MSIKLKVTDDNKKLLANLSVEVRVLNTLANERRFIMEQRANAILKGNDLDPKLYAMQFNPSEDKWTAILRPGAITVPTPGTDLSKIKTN